MDAKESLLSTHLWSWNILLYTALLTSWIHVVVLVAKSCLTPCDPTDCSSTGSSIHRILQARTLEWVVISSSRASSGPRSQTRVSYIVRQVLYYLSRCGSPHELIDMLKKRKYRISLAVPWLKLCTPSAGDTGLIPDQGRPACHIVQPKKSTTRKKKVF